MTQFTWHMCTEIRFGRGVVNDVGHVLAERDLHSALIVTDPGLQATGVVSQVEESIEAAGARTETFAEVDANPRTDQVESALHHAREAAADVVVGVGGGSSMDVAKALGVLLTNDGPIDRYQGGTAVPIAPAPVIALPTTAGTGAEVTPFAVFSRAAEHVKFSVGHQHFAARLALVDPELTRSLPPAVTAATGMDALSHAIESYLARTTHPASEALALRAMSLIAGNIERATHEGHDLDAREAMLLGSLLAGMAFISTRLGVMHAVAIPIGAHTDLPHGLILAASLEPGLRFNEVAVPDRCEDIAHAVGGDGDAAAAVAALRNAVELPERLGPLGLTEAMVEPICAEAMMSPNINSNPREMTPDALAEVVEALL